VVVRRTVALGFLAVLLAGLGWGAAVAIGKLRGSPSAPATSAVAPRPAKPFRIVFPEGFTRLEMAERITKVDAIAFHERHVHPRLSAKAYLAATASSTLPGKFAGDRKRRSLEGFLFPATYDFLRATRSKQLVAAQLVAFHRAWKGVDLRYARSKHLTPFDVLIIASMVEKEAVAPDERPKIAAVIYNRLHLGMRLEIDATIRYGLNVPGTQPLHDSQLHDPNPYNTRVHAGLPPGPIANPGLASIQAAAHPAPVNYLYFVRKPDKVHHFFTASFAAFQAYASSHGF
jgi:UPF0755 protein